MNRTRPLFFLSRLRTALFPLVLVSLLVCLMLWPAVALSETLVATSPEASTHAFLPEASTVALPEASTDALPKASTVALPKASTDALPKAPVVASPEVPPASTNAAPQPPPAVPTTDPLADLPPSDPEAEQPHAVALPVPAGFNPWDEPEPGFEFARFPALSAQGRNMDIMVVRVDPALFDIVIRTATTPGEQPRTLQDWAARHNLFAVINAGMYLPDGLTNTGYLRVGEHLNNPRINGTFGAFLVAEPLETTPATPVTPATASTSFPTTSRGTLRAALPVAPPTQSGAQPERMPSARLLERGEPGWEEELTRHRSVVQNYRMVSANRRLLWRPSPQEHAIAAIGRDSKGRILLIHCREPVTGVDFATMVLDLPIDLGTLMYLEGGTQAGLFVRPGGSQLRMGRHPADFWTDGSVKQLLPNIIGVKPKGRQ